MIRRQLARLGSALLLAGGAAALGLSFGALWSVGTAQAGSPAAPSNGPSLRAAPRPVEPHPVQPRMEGPVDVPVESEAISLASDRRGAPAQPSSGAAIVARVVDSRGRPVAAQVELWSDTVRFEGELDSTTGSARLGAPEGRYRLRVVPESLPPGWRPARTRELAHALAGTFAHPVDFDGSADVTVERVVVRPSLVRGVVRALDQRPVQRARVTLAPGARSAEQRTVTTDEDGRFAFGDLVAGRYAVLVGGMDTRLGVAPGPRWIELAPGAERRVDVDLVPAAGQVQGRLVDNDGHGLARHRVFAVVPEAVTGSTSLATSNPPIAAVTGADGRFQLLGLAPGRYELRASEIPVRTSALGRTLHGEGVLLRAIDAPLRGDVCELGELGLSEYAGYCLEGIVSGTAEAVAELWIARASGVSRQRLALEAGAFAWSTRELTLEAELVVRVGDEELLRKPLALGPRVRDVVSVRAPAPR